MLLTRVVWLFVMLVSAESQGGILYELVKGKKVDCQNKGQQCSGYRRCCGEMRCMVHYNDPPYCASLNGAKEVWASPVFTFFCVVTSLVFIYCPRRVLDHVSVLR
ncbi:hypothetical protein BsWGS_28264 [Bradybaena similaris]